MQGHNRLQYRGLMILVLMISLTGCEKEVIKVKEDKIPPAIVSDPVADVSSHSAVISWVTDEPCSTLVKYVQSTSTDTSLISGTEFRQYHSIKIPNLLDETTYFFRTISFDQAGNHTNTLPSSFTTALDTQNYITQGWSHFESDNFVNAVLSFSAYIDINSSSTEAFTGLGWSMLKIDSLYAASTGPFQSALNLDNEYVDAMAGMTFALFKINDLTGVKDYGESTLSNDSLYIFSHDSAYSHTALRLMLAEAYVNFDMYDNAQRMVDLVYPDNNLSPGDSTTWVVGDTSYSYTYPTYEEALTAYIEYLQWLLWDVAFPKPGISEGLLSVTRQDYHQYFVKKNSRLRDESQP